MQSIWKDLQEPKAAYRPQAFWSWNDRLDVQTCREQIAEMARAGLGGFFMHARTGLRTDYLGTEWFAAVRASIQAAKAEGLQAWGYDEDGWPSGFAGGAVQAADGQTVVRWLEAHPWQPELSGEILACYRQDEAGNWQVCQGDAQPGDMVVTICTNPGYVDLLSEKTTELFLKTTHDRYCRELGEDASGLQGFFTDEPQYRREQIPYSPAVETAFWERHGTSLKACSIALFLDTPDASAVRYDYYRVVSEAFVQNFTRQVENWHRRHGMTFTGHFLHEDSLCAQMQGSAGVMPHYAEMTLPGMDWLGREIGGWLTPKQLGSVAAQTGKNQALAETFALCGWNVSFAQLKNIAHWQMVNGVTLLSPHLQGYSLRGFRKRDYPPSLFFQQPYWPQYRRFNVYAGRLGELFAHCPETADVCMIHPMRSAWCAWNGEETSVQELDASLEATSRAFAEHQITWHYADEGLLAQMASVDSQGMLRVGKCVYRCVVLPFLYSLDAATLDLLEAFAKQGGRIYALGSLPTRMEGRPDPQLKKRLESLVQTATAEQLKQWLDDGCPQAIRLQRRQKGQEPRLQIMRRETPDATLYMIANLSAQKDAELDIAIKGVAKVEDWDLWEYERTVLPATAQDGWLQVHRCIGAQQAAILVCTKRQHRVRPEGMLEIRRMERNALTLDTAEYRLDGGDWQEAKAVIRIMKELLQLRRTVEVSLRFRFTCAVDPATLSELCLVMEDPEQCTLVVNGRKVPFADAGWWRDTALRVMDIRAYCVQGENTLCLERTFTQREQVYHVLFDPDVLETETNKLTYDTELESIYLCGNFGVRDNGKPEPAPNGGYFTTGPFEITAPPTQLSAEDVARQGLLFYAGNLHLVQSFVVDDPKAVWTLELPRAPRCAALELYVNGRYLRCWAGGPLQTDISDLVHPGHNEIEYLLCGTNRNLLGPHHFAGGESWSVGPDTFGETGGWTEPPALRGAPIWTDRYCFVPFGL